MDLSLFSRAVTKLSRSMAVTTPNTICLRLGEPSVRSRGEREGGGGGGKREEGEKKETRQAKFRRYLFVYQFHFCRLFYLVCSHDGGYFDWSLCGLKDLKLFKSATEATLLSFIFSWCSGFMKAVDIYTDTLNMVTREAMCALRD